MMFFCSCDKDWEVTMYITVSYDEAVYERPLCVQPHSTTCWSMIWVTRAWKLTHSLMGWILDQLKELRCRIQLDRILVVQTVEQQLEPLQAQSSWSHSLHLTTYKALLFLWYHNMDDCDLPSYLYCWHCRRIERNSSQSPIHPQQTSSYIIHPSLPPNKPSQDEVVVSDFPAGKFGCTCPITLRYC